MPRRRLITRLLCAYAVLIAVAVHLLVLGLWVAKPGLLDKVHYRASEWLSEHLPSVFASEAELAAKIPVQLNQVVPAWQPAPATGQVAPGKAMIGDRVFNNLSQAAAALHDGDTLMIGPGTYHQALVIKANSVTLIGDGHVVLSHAQARGKGMIVASGNDLRVINIECSQVQVRDGNGACVRLQATGLTLDHVYFHDAQEGVLTGAKPGFVEIRNSRFERLGYRGQAHAIYIGGGRLLVEHSVFLASKSEGHEIKSRAADTLLIGNVIASLNGHDSRLVDVPNGGNLTLLDNVLEKGPHSSNRDLIGYGLETNRPQHKGRQVVMRNNTFIMERVNGNQLLHSAGEMSPPVFDNNLVVGPSRPRLMQDGVNNRYASDRQDAGLQPYPALPPVPAS